MLVATPMRAWAEPAEKAARVVVVEIAAEGSEIDGVELRSAIARELGAEAVAPDDPSAAQATGTLRISVDRPSHALVVAYRGSAEPIERRVDLPPDCESIERAAVFLRGNLARDEGDELAAWA